MIAIIKQAPSFLCNNNYDRKRIRSDYPKHAQKAPDRTACLTGKAALPSGTATVRMLCLRNRRKGHPFCRLQSENGIVTPPLPLNAVVAQRGASWGIYQREKKRTNLRCGSRSARPASIANGFPFAAETGEPVPLFSLQEKGWRQLRPPFHIGRAVPAGISELTVFANWRQNKKTRKILESEKEKTTIIAYN